MEKNKLHLVDYFTKGINFPQIISIFLILSLSSLLGCKDDDNVNAPPQQVQTLSVADTAFMRNATLFNLAEISLGRLALTN